MLNDSVKPRDYQKNIAETALKQSTLVVLPTGMGKTLIAVLVAVKRLEQYPDSNILVMAPTRPLNAQHQKSFSESLDIPENEIVLVTGKITPADRIQIYKKSKIIIATPQTIENDLENGKLHLENFSFVVFDEAHRAVKDYAYPYVAKKYMLQAKHPLILALTASPGASKEKIEEICSNLFIKAVEIRSHVDTDVEAYVKPIEHEVVFVELPEEFKKVKSMLEEVLKDDLYWLKEHHYTFTYKPTKKMLLGVQMKVIASLSKKNYVAFWAMLRVAGAIKTDHALNLLETQDMHSLYVFLKKIATSKKKTDTRLAKSPRFLEAFQNVSELHEKNIEHPKLGKTIEVIKNILSEKPSAKLIVFANFRSTVDKINRLLNGSGVKSTVLIGQSVKEGKGLTQQEQIDTIKRFGEGEFSVMCGTQVSEEGLSIVDVDAVIFYEPVASEIRAIQRRGRTGRTSAGRVIFMITKDTRDEAYYYAALKKESKMKDILYKMKEKGVNVKRDINLLDFK